MKIAGFIDLDQNGIHIGIGLDLFRGASQSLEFRDQTSVAGLQDLLQRQGDAAGGIVLIPVIGGEIIHVVAEKSL